MKLSEAIRKGAAIRPYTAGSLFGESRDESICSCAIGAAAEGAGLVTQEEIEGIVNGHLSGSHLYNLIQDTLAGGARNSAELRTAFTEHGLFAAAKPFQVTTLVHIANDRAPLVHGDKDPRLAIADALDAVGL